MMTLGLHCFFFLWQGRICFLSFFMWEAFMDFIDDFGAQVNKHIYIGQH